jgi:ribA/ribD-fused uncharacterized protein
MKYSLSWLQEQIEQEIAVEYLFFWGHRPKQAGVTDRSCFSQWYPSPFMVDGITYKTTEHWMMAHKALLFGDKITLQEIIKTESPAVVKQLGREVKNFDAGIWNEKAYKIVVEGNKHKFSQSPGVRQVLLYSGNRILVEASPPDAIWGIGLAQDSPDASNPFKWKGTNLLGFALMEVRDYLRD